MNLQRREEISALLAEPVTGGAGQVLEYRDALMECRAHIDALEQAAAERVIADGSRGPTPDYTGEGSAWVPPVEAPAVVVPEPTSDEWRAIAENARSSDMVDFLAGAAAYSLWLRRRARVIPADRVLGEGVVALRRFAERCAQRDHQPDEHIGRAKCVSCEAEDALRANQGGTNE